MEVAEMLAAAVKQAKPIACKDCAHYRYSSLGAQYATCVSPESYGIRRDGYTRNPVSIERKAEYEILGTCGPGARFFDPKPPKRWWEFWK